jgi:hypothetical protein
MATVPLNAVAARMKQSDGTEWIDDFDGCLEEGFPERSP